MSTPPDPSQSTQYLGAAAAGNDKLRNTVAWLIVSGTSLFGFFALVAVVHAGFASGPHGDLYFAILRDHFVAVFGLPMAAVAALFIVTVLRSTEGRMEFSALGLKFKGASGPVVLWVVTFLAIALALKMLWSSETFSKGVPSNLNPDARVVNSSR